MSKLPIQPQDKYVLRLPDGMRDRIKLAADKNNRSMNAEIISRIEFSFAKEEEQQEWDRYIEFLEKDQAHVEGEYLAGKTDNPITPDDEENYIVKTDLVRTLSRLVNKRTEIAMRTIVEELDKKGLLAAEPRQDRRPTREEWQELRSAPRDVQPEILDALAQVDIDRALSIARSRRKKGAA